LIVFNIIFAVENVLDLRYLPHSRNLPAGMTYKEYVHRGAYPLIAAALLAGAFVLVTFRPGSSTERSPAARRMVYFWIAQTVLLTLSAAWRLYRYVQMSELTRLRVASGIWFALVASGLIYIVWRIVQRKSNTWLVNLNAITALLLLYPRLPMATIVGSDIAHAVPLTLVAGIGHWALGSVDWALMGVLLIGSLPGIIIGSYCAVRVPETVLRLLLATVLILIAGKLGVNELHLSTASVAAVAKSATH